MPKKFNKHFRIYFKSNHPAYIVDEEGNKFIFHRVTSQEKSGTHRKWKIFPNPDKRKKSPMYIVHQQQKDKKEYFSAKLPYNIELSFVKINKKR